MNIYWIFWVLLFYKYLKWERGICLIVGLHAVIWTIKESKKWITSVIRLLSSAAVPALCWGCPWLVASQPSAPRIAARWPSPGTARRTWSLSPPIWSAAHLRNETYRLTLLGSMALSWEARDRLFHGTVSVCICETVCCDSKVKNRTAFWTTPEN